MQKILNFFVTLLLSVSLCHAAHDPLVTTVEQFVRDQTQGMSGEISITISTIEGRQNLPKCTAYQAYLPAGAKVLGNVSIGVRCLTPSAWSLFVPVKVAVFDRYFISSRALSSGQAISTDDLSEMRGDIALLPSGTLTRRDQIVGKTPRYTIGAGQPLRAEQLVAVALVKQNQSVRVVARGNGFTASTEGKALNNAGEGQVVQVRTVSGSTVSGVVQADGSIFVNTGN